MVAQLVPGRFSACSKAGTVWLAHMLGWFSGPGRLARGLPALVAAGKAWRLPCRGTELSRVGRSWLVQEEGGFWGRGSGACLRLYRPARWQDDQPRAFPGPSGSRSAEAPAGMRRKEATMLLAANFTANNR